MALQEADARNARIVLGDRPVDVTMKRLSEAMSLQELLSMAMGSMQVSHAVSNDR